MSNLVFTKMNKVQFANYLSKSVLLDFRGGKKRINQDLYHDKIITYLGQEKMKYAPMAVIKKEEDFEEFKLKYWGNGSHTVIKTPFLRDCLHVRSDININRMFFYDTLLDSKFAKNFNAIVNEANRLIKLAPWWNPWKKVPKEGIRRLDHLAHRDAIQIIPPDKGLLDRYTTSSIKEVNINGVCINSRGDLQCIFSGDGIIQKLNMRNCTLNTKGSHPATISGVLDASIRDIKIYGREDKVKLTPLRIGGGKCNYYVIGFKGDGPYQYKKIRNRWVTDLRQEPVQNHTNLVDFDLEAFRSIYIRNRAKGIEKFKAIDKTIEEMIAKNKTMDLTKLMQDLLDQ